MQIHKFENRSTKKKKTEKSSTNQILKERYLLHELIPTFNFQYNSPNYQNFNYSTFTPIVIHSHRFSSGQMSEFIRLKYFIWTDLITIEGKSMTCNYRKISRTCQLILQIIKTSILSILFEWFSIFKRIPKQLRRKSIQASHPSRHHWNYSKMSTN